MKRPTLKIVVIGSARYTFTILSVGKTSLLHQYINNLFISQYKTTIGTDFLVKELNSEGKSIVVQIWDTAGQERFQGVQKVFYRGADACVLVFDLTNPKSFQMLEWWKSEFAIAAGISKTTFPFILIGNKEDLADERLITRGEITQWCKDSGDPPYYETSAKTAKRVKEAFDDIAYKLAASKNTKLHSLCIKNKHTIASASITSIKRAKEYPDNTKSCC
eukprot:TRINITY_DN4780_c0_g4_i1.p1 TRINITY_DN4780_c0_g4~~TRINITY_DN4780_c0_g4_i1.p1  ORF type:complete len:219 (-),score=39.92 TRINITY_DN4780_c0_g4_i1:104-760(-)